GNWKMNGLRSALGEIRAAADGAAALADRLDMVLCPPATLLYVATTLTEDTPLEIGAQDCHFAVDGAHTGDLSAGMIADCFATHVIVGHSERRAAYDESDTTVAAKAAAAHPAGLTAIICIGETEAERRAGRTLDVIGRQLAGSLPEGSTAENTIVAYEPVWAIGTGRTPTVEDVAEVHRFMREALAGRFPGEGTRMRLLYGGSVKPANAAELMAVANVDGALVGGASLKAPDFLAICGAYRALSG
ncbi:MAG: triose-phosphate isomerase, partial [Pararhizobium sp.]